MMEPWWSTTSAWTALLSLKAMTDGMNDLGQITPLGYLGRTRIRTDVSDVKGVVLGQLTVWG